MHKYLIPIALIIFPYPEQASAATKKDLLDACDKRAESSTLADCKNCRHDSDGWLECIVDGHFIRCPVTGPCSEVKNVRIPKRLQNELQPNAATKAR